MIVSAGIYDYGKWVINESDKTDNSAFWNEISQMCWSGYITGQAISMYVCIKWILISSSLVWILWQNPLHSSPASHKHSSFICTQSSPDLYHTSSPTWSFQLVLGLPKVQLFPILICFALKGILLSSTSSGCPYHCMLISPTSMVLSRLADVA
jgi:hypothetical protein